MYIICKRIFDTVAALLLAIVISPILLILIILVSVKMGWPFYFTQIRTTKDMKEFRLYKFRSMTNAKDANGNLLPDELRRTKFGNWLRATSLDELPELFNIIKGDMAVIGPRPLLPITNPYYRPSEMDRFKVLGGLIPPEVRYRRTNPSWDEQLGWEAEYGRNCSLWLDIQIYISVFVVLFKRNKEGFGAVTRGSLAKERPEMIKGIKV
jgi:lipopolysaccharide/colanic/teichoic acid biosynthesis glycosyltransferase